MTNVGPNPGISFFTIFFGYSISDPNRVDVFLNFIRPRNGYYVTRYYNVSDASIARIIARCDPASARIKTDAPSGRFNRTVLIALSPA